MTTGTVEMTMLVNADMNWKYSFENVVVKDRDGIRYEYRVEEVVPEGYRASYDGYNITNTKLPDTPPEKPGGSNRSNTWQTRETSWSNTTCKTNRPSRDKSKDFS